MTAPSGTPCLSGNHAGRARAESPHKRCGLRRDRTKKCMPLCFGCATGCCGRARVTLRGAIGRRRYRDRTDAAAHGRKESSRAVRLLVRMRVAARTRARAHTPIRTPHGRPRSAGTLIGSPSLAPARVAVAWVCTSATRNAQHSTSDERQSTATRQTAGSMRYGSEPGADDAEAGTGTCCRMVPVT